MAKKKDTQSTSQSTSNEDKGYTTIRAIWKAILIIIWIILGIVLIAAAYTMIQDYFDPNTNYSSRDTYSSETEIEDDEEEKEEIVKAKFKKQTIYEGNDVLIKVTGYEYTSNGVDIKIYIENNSDLNLSFAAHSYGVNGIMTRNNIYDMYTDVAAGKKANTTLTISNSFLNKYEMDYIKYIDVLFWAYDNDKDFKEFDTGVVTIKTDKYDDTKDWMKGKEIYNKNGIKVAYLSRNSNQVKYVVTNTTGNNLELTFEGISINDYTMSDTDLDLFDEQVLNNNQIVFVINVEKDFKKENDIEKIEKVDFYFSYIENNDFINEHKTENMTTTFKK